MSFVRWFATLFCLLVPSFAAAASGGGAAPDTGQVPNLPYVSRIHTRPEQPNVNEPTSLLIEGWFPSGCGTLRDAVGVDPQFVLVWLQSTGPCDSSSAHDWGVERGLGYLPGGRHRVTIELKVDSAGDPSQIYLGQFEFFVQGDSIPTPPGPLPYVDEIRIEPQSIYDPIVRPLCPSDSIRVRVRGTFPNPCFRLLRIDVFPSPIVGPEPEPPVVRFVVDDRTCIGRCAMTPTPWDAFVVLPPLPPREYGLWVELGQVSCPDTIPVNPNIFQTTVPFTVERCGQPPGENCVMGGWQPGGGHPCTAVISPGGSAQLTFNVAATIALAGLQGEFSTQPLAVTNLETVGPAQGMHLNWRPTDRGARFTLFADHGAPIPPGVADSLHPATQPAPILRLTLAAHAVQLPPITHVVAGALFGSDIGGHAVPECNWPTFAPVEATVCAQRGCDFNADGRADVRDLVLMAHCLVGTQSTDSAGNVYRTPCADSAAVPDCNADGTKDLRDVICCALGILRELECPGCPPDTTHPRPAPNVRVTLGAPVFEDGAARIEIGIDGASEIGGAVLRFQFPADRYEARFELPESPTALMLSDVAAGVATLGFVRLDGPEVVPQGSNIIARPLVLRLTLKPGQSHGGEVALESAEFSALDGVKLEAAHGPAPRPLAGAPRLALSEAQPNPFAGETRFRLTLDRSARVTVGIYDLGGRLVAMLHRGELGAGAHDFAWNGARDGGSAAQGGVYFYRAAAGGATASRKMVLLGR